MFRAVCLGLPVFAAAAAGGQTCEPHWLLDTFCMSGIHGGASTNIVDFTTYDDGSGSMLVMVGDFDIAGCAYGRGIAAWDGERWRDFGTGLTSGELKAVAAYDDGTGEALYAAGRFSRIDGVDVTNIAKYDGTRWTPLSGPGGDDLTIEVNDLIVFDDGSGSALYACGSIREVAGQRVQGVIRWNGQWSPVGDDLRQPDITTLAVFDDGTGPALYAAGEPNIMREGPTSAVAKWNGTDWIAVPGAPEYGVLTLAAHDDGSGPALYAAGYFEDIQGEPVDRIAHWDGASWAEVGEGFSYLAWNLLSFDDGSGPALYAASRGEFVIGSMGQPESPWGVARWNGTVWRAVGAGLAGEVRTLAAFDPGDGPRLFAGGGHRLREGLVDGLTQWDGQRWGPLSEGIGGVNALAEFDDGRGPAIYMGLGSPWRGEQWLGYLARWDGESYEAVGGGMDNYVRELLVVEAPSGDLQAGLYALGEFREAGGIPALRAARFDGARWYALGDGPASLIYREYNGLLADTDDLLGVGPSIYAIGEGIGRWDGVQWHPLGTPGHRLFDRPAKAMAIYDDGTGPALYVGGSFTTVDGLPFAYAARWDGTQWSPVGFPARSIEAMLVDDFGYGEALYASGQFTDDSGTVYAGVARWDGQVWVREVETTGSVARLLATYRGASVTKLILGGAHYVDGQDANFLAQWDGIEAKAVGDGLDNLPNALLSTRINGLPSLLVGGGFQLAGGTVSSGVAIWQGCPLCPPDLDGDGRLTIFDFLRFQNLFDVGDPGADFDGDGVLTIFDFLAFQNAFDAGCE